MPHGTVLKWTTPEEVVQTDNGDFFIADLRELAYEWHGGQWSPLYAFASSGAIVSGLSNEVQQCVNAIGAGACRADCDARDDSDTIHDLPKLWALRDYADAIETAAANENEED